MGRLEVTLHNRTYSILERKNSTWFDVHKDKIGIIAIVSEQKEAYQCIYNDLRNNGFSCKFLSDSDFKVVG